MDERILKWLYDIKFFIEEIDGFFEEEGKDFFKYKNNLMRKRQLREILRLLARPLTE